MLIFVGLGLYDGADISVKGMAAVQAADTVFLEYYTSKLTGISVEEMNALYGREIVLLHREDVEQHPEAILKAATDGTAVVLCGGDPMVSTTHADLRIRAEEAGIPSKIIHGASISSAVCGITGLQNYRFGKSCSIPYPCKGWFPTTPLEVIDRNLALNLHTLVYLDIQPDRFMTVSEGTSLLKEMAKKEGTNPPALYIGIARAGSDEPVVVAGDAERMKTADFGGPLHVLVVPAELHHIERDYLEVFAGL